MSFLKSYPLWVTLYTIAIDFGACKQKKSQNTLHINLSQEEYELIYEAQNKKNKHFFLYQNNLRNLKVFLRTAI